MRMLQPQPGYKKEQMVVRPGDAHRSRWDRHRHRQLPVDRMLQGKLAQGLNLRGVERKSGGHYRVRRSLSAQEVTIGSGGHHRLRRSLSGQEVTIGSGGHYRVRRSLSGQEVTIGSGGHYRVRRSPSGQEVTIGSGANQGFTRTSYWGVVSYDSQVSP